MSNTYNVWQNGPESWNPTCAGTGDSVAGRRLDDAPRFYLEGENPAHSKKACTTGQVLKSLNANLDVASFDIPGFILIDQIGSGSSGDVYLAEDISLARKVAIKILRTGSNHNALRFAREAIALARPVHKNLLQIYRTGSCSKGAYLVMEYAACGTLRDYMANRKVKFPHNEAAKIVKVIADTLQACHQEGVLHRDLKPSNIFIDGRRELKLGDFGLAKLTEDDLSLTAGPVGTLGYMPPEQTDWGTELTPAADVYGAGAILYELLTGRPLFETNVDMRTMVRYIRKGWYLRPHEIDSSIPWSLEAICLKCLAPRPSERYQSARELCEDLTSFTQGQPVSVDRRCRSLMVRAFRLSVDRLVGRDDGPKRGRVYAVITFMTLLSFLLVYASAIALAGDRRFYYEWYPIYSLGGLATTLHMLVAYSQFRSRPR